MNGIFSFCFIWYGERAYKRLLKDHGDKTILVVPTGSAGDLLYLRMGLDSLIELGQKTPYILVMQQNVKKLAFELNYPNTVFVKKSQALALAAFCHFMFDKEIRAYDIYSWIILDVKRANLSRPYPVFPHIGVEEKYGLGASHKKGVLLAPYEYSLTDAGYEIPPESFWQKLAAGLNEKGYTVYCNCKNSEEEPLIEGTIHLFPAIIDSEEVVSYLGGIVAIRSGLIDYCCNAEAVKVVLYPDEMSLKRFSTNENTISNDVVEIVYSHLSFDEDLIDRILGLFEGGSRYV